MTEKDWAKQYMEDMDELKPVNTNPPIKLRSQENEKASEEAIGFNVSISEDRKAMKVEYAGPIQQSVSSLADAMICGLLKVIVDQEGDPKVTIAKMLHYLQSVEPELYKRHFGEKSGILLPDGKIV